MNEDNRILNNTKECPSFICIWGGLGFGMVDKMKGKECNQLDFGRLVEGRKTDFQSIDNQ